MPIKINRIPGLAFVCMGIIPGLLFSWLMLTPGANTRFIEAQEDYGQTLATATARRVIDAFFKNDLVRLQAVLQDLVSYPHVVQATIHDVENRLLVQAGEGRPALSEHSAYSASIVIHDSIAGYITLTLQKFDQPLQNASRRLVNISIFLVLALMVILYRAHSFEWIRSEPDKKEILAENSDEIEKTATENSANMEDLVYTIIHVKNLDVLNQQLTNDVKRGTFGKLENILRDVQALYGGQGFYLQDNFYVLKFATGDTLNETLFRAACSAFLIVELASIIDKIPLDLAAFVSANEADLVPAKLPVAGLVLESQAAQDELIQRRLNFMEVGTADGRSIVANFEQPYSALLENQRKHLASLLNHGSKK